MRQPKAADGPAVTPSQMLADLGAGCVTTAAAALRCSRAALYNWLHAGVAPELYRFRYVELMAARNAGVDRRRSR